MQWHPTILSRLALVPQRSLAGYSQGNLGEEYETGDFVVIFEECTTAGDNSCEDEAGKYWKQWRDAFGVEATRA